jgi:hypothetical protein
MKHRSGETISRPTLSPFPGEEDEGEGFCLFLHL